MKGRVAIWLVAIVLAASNALFAQQPNEFVPMKDLPSEALPATPLVFIAYGFVWVVLLVYVTTIWKRLGRVERELHGLASKPHASSLTPHT